MLAPGVLIGKYEVLEPIGEGGMGEVWKARDTTLEREVALKTLPDALARDPRRLARLEREARLLASLSHPNIAGIHGLEKSDGTTLLELELVKGQTLGELLEAGPMAIETALKIAVQIAEALEAAHTEGIVHRDLKPSNVMLTPGGAVKVLDFGLAKMVSVDSTPASHGLDPTASVTREGVIQGTPAYMSPEQIRSGRIDAQTDICAFGCILFEMLAGGSPFAQKSSTETLGKVLERAPDFERLRPDTPAPVVRLLRRCLEKDPRDRLHHIGDARIELRDALASPTPQSAEGALASAWPSRGLWAWTAGVAALVAIAASTAAFLVPRFVPESRPVPALYPAAPPVRGPRLVVGGDRVVSISADGRRLAYVSDEEIWLQTLGRQDASPLARSGRRVGNPFFSSDGEWVAFISWGDSLLRKVSIHDRVPITVAELGNERFLGGAWLGQTIVFATQRGVYSVSADQDGGEAELVIEAPEDLRLAGVPARRAVRTPDCACWSLDQRHRNRAARSRNQAAQ